MSRASSLSRKHSRSNSVESNRGGKCPSENENAAQEISSVPTEGIADVKPEKPMSPQEVIHPGDEIHSAPLEDDGKTLEFYSSLGNFDRPPSWAPTKKASASGIPLPTRQPISTSKMTTNKPGTPVILKKPSSRSSTRENNTEVNLLKRDHVDSVSGISRRGLEIQFIAKKKKLDSLKKELCDKQKPILDLYQHLLSMKRKLEDMGKAVILDNLKFLDVDHPRAQSESKLPIKSIMAKTRDNSLNREPKKIAFDKKVAGDSLNTLKELPNTISVVCRSLLEERNKLLSMMERQQDPTLSQDFLMQQVESYKQETKALEKTVEDAVSSQEKHVGDFIKNWMVSLDKSVPDALTENEALRSKLRSQEKALVDTMGDLQRAQTQLREECGFKDKLDVSQKKVEELGIKVKTLENELNHERCRIKERTAASDQKTKALKGKIKELEAKTKDQETKIVDLTNALRQTQNNLKITKETWDKEKQDIAKIRKQDQMVIEKMTKDKATLDSRLSAITSVTSEKENELRETIHGLQMEIEKSRQVFLEEKMRREDLQKKSEQLENEITQMRIANQQAVDVVLNRKEMDKDHGEGDIRSLREQELTAELKATRIALKDAQEQLEFLAAEKLRFLESIDNLNVTSEKDKENIARCIIQKDEQISAFETTLKEKSDVISHLNVELKNLQAKLNYMEAGADAAEFTQNIDSVELKETINEGRLKLEYALKKSLENEQKIIKYEDEIERHTKRIGELETLLKVRDGLIGTIKIKKDEVESENASLTKYSNEMRQLLLEAKEEIHVKNDIIAEMTANLTHTQKSNVKLEKKIKELENSLTSTNEKRFKLQDTIVSKERELQTTKAHVNQLTEMQTRARFKFLRPW